MFYRRLKLYFELAQHLCVSQLKYQMTMKENEIQRVKHEWSQTMASVERERQEMSDFRVQMDSLRDSNNTLQRDIRALQDVISEQKVSVRRVDYIRFYQLFRPQLLTVSVEATIRWYNGWLRKPLNSSWEPLKKNYRFNLL